MKRTVIVVGAGASVDFGLPSGEALGQLVADAVRPDQHSGYWAFKLDALQYAFSQREGGLRPYLNAGRKISDGVTFAASVDDYLFTHGEDEALVELGKAAIALCILEKERGSPLKRLSAHDPITTSRELLALRGKAWPLELIRLLMAQKRRSEVASLFAGITFINFNYDRCLEHLLYYALQKIFDISDMEAAEILKALTIIHPYGTVGPLPWQAQTDGQAFGGDPHPSQVQGMIRQIRTLNDGCASDDVQVAITEAMTYARRLLFLGFGFHKQNVELLSFEKITQTGLPPRIFGTALGASESNKRMWINAAKSAVNYGSSTQPVHMVDLDCTAVFQHWGREILG